MQTRSTPTFGFLTRMPGGEQDRQMLLGARQMAQELNIRLLAVKAEQYFFGTLSPTMKHIDGWIIACPPTTDPPSLALTALPHQPIVTINHKLPNHPAILSDYRTGMRSAVEHLLSHGHQHIAFVGNLREPITLQQYAGYRDTLLEYNLPLDPDYVVSTPDSDYATQGKQVGEDLLRRRLPCTALVTTQQRHSTLALIQYLQKRGYTTPNEIAIISFDTETTTYKDPQLSIVQPQFYEQGRLALQLLHHKMCGHDDFSELIYVPTTLSPRRSCGCQEAQGVKTTTQYGADKQQYLESLEQYVRMSQRLSIQLLTMTPQQIYELAWLQYTHATWGCLALWDKTASRAEFIVASTYHGDTQQQHIQQGQHLKIDDLFTLTSSARSTEITTLLHLHTSTNDWGMFIWGAPETEQPDQNVLIYTAIPFLVAILEHQQSTREQNEQPKQHTSQQRKIMGNKTQAAGQSIAQLALSYIHLHYHHHITRQQIAQHIGIQEDYLSRCFRRETGKTPMSYLLQYRMQQAMQLLAEGTAVGTTAMRVGFATTAHFCRVFRREVGMTPSTYRQQERSERTPLAVDLIQHN